VCDDLRTPNGGDPDRLRQGLPGSRETLVASRVIGMDVGVDNVTDGLVGELANRSKQRLSRLRIQRVHKQYAVATNLHSDVAALAREHVYVALNRQKVDFIHPVALAALGARRCAER
jgi:hypothetical protein